MKPPLNYWNMARGTIALQDEKPCDCNTDLVIHNYYTVCPSCGTIHETDISQDFGFVPQKRKFHYSKVNYFHKYIMCLQGMSAFNPKTHGLDISQFFPRKNPNITKKEIRAVLKEQKCSQKYLRYLPEIYYIITGYQPIRLRNSDVQDMVDKYKRVVEYERTNNIRLPSAKRYFAKRFLQELGRPYSCLAFFIEPFRHVDKSIYKECYDTLFSQ